MIVSGEADASQAFHKLGYSQYEKLGSQPGGAISYLTEGRLTREACIKYSIIMALIQLEKHQYYH